MFDFQPYPDEAARRLVGDMIRHTGTRPSDVLMLGGGGNSALLLELCRRGFAQVCLATAPCPTAAGTADVLWLPHASAETLGHRLHGYTQALREGGTIVLQGDAPASCERVTALRRLLLTEGFYAIGQAVGASGFCLFARKPWRAHQHRIAA
jgi:hypothetical protein